MSEEGIPWIGLEDKEERLCGRLGGKSGYGYGWMLVVVRLLEDLVRGN